MDLHVLLSDFVKSKGSDILASPLLCNMMDDELMFRPFEHRDYKLLFRLMVKKGYIQKILNLASWDIYTIDSLKMRIANDYSGVGDIDYALQCIGFSIGLITEVVEPVNNPAAPIEQRIELDAELVKYIPHGSTKSIGTMISASMATPIHEHLNRIALEEGGVGTFVMTELNMSSQDELESKLSGEQIDGVAMAITQMKKERGFIIGDMTGVGKGRQLAALVLWAVLQGKKPVYVTEKSNLFSDLYRDMVDIGCGYLRPFILNSDAEATITDPNGHIAYHKPSEYDLKEFRNSKRIPDGYNFLMLTYSQLSRVGSKNWKVECVKSAIENSYLIMDESHNASGDESNVGKFFREVIQLAKGVCFASATYAKYPSSMPIYALKTAMGETKLPAEVLIETIKEGGAVLQEIMAKGLVESGSMIRRQRDMSDVKREQYLSNDAEKIILYRNRYDNVIELLEEIHEFQERYIKPYIMSQNAEAIIRKNYKITSKENIVDRKSRIYYNHFSALMMPVIKLLLFAIKADDAVDVTLRELAKERKPIIQINHTMASILSKIIDSGETFQLSDFVKILPEYMNGMFQYVARCVTFNISNNSSKYKVYTKKCSCTFHDIYLAAGDNDAEEEYNIILDKIKNFDSGLPLSPIDYFIQRIKSAGYRVGELTERKQQLVYEDVDAGANSKCRYAPRKKKSKKKVAAEFNNGEIDVIIGNRVMASGISLHNSNEFADQRGRTVVTWEHQDSADRQVQFDGRADRTGQLSHSDFVTIMSPIPAERRFIMQNERKLHSLYANIEANQRISDSDCDIMNEYGKRVVIEFTEDNPETKDLFNTTSPIWGNNDNDFVVKSFFRGLCLAPCSTQETVVADVMSRYNELLKTVDEAGRNRLRCNIMPLKASLLNRGVFFAGTKGSNSIFAKDTYLDEVEMDVLRHPMTSTEILSLKTTLKDAEFVKNLIIKYRERKRSELVAFYHELEQNALDKIDKLKQGVITARVSKRIEELKDQSYNKKQLETKLFLLNKRINGLINCLKHFIPLQAVAIPPTLMDVVEDPQLIDSISRGMFLGYRVSGKKFSPGSVSAVFAILGSERKIEIKLIDYPSLNNIDRQTHLGIVSNLLQGLNISTWNNQIIKKKRTKGYLFTGNILLGMASLKRLSHAVKSLNHKDVLQCKLRLNGYLIKYNDDKGHICTGYIMPAHFDSNIARQHNKAYPLKWLN